MHIIKNPHRKIGLPHFADGSLLGGVSVASDVVLSLLRHCPIYSVTPLVDVPSLAQRVGIESLLCKDERDRMGLGSFKALGAAYVIAKCAYERFGDEVFDPQKASEALRGETFVAASAGNHGLSLAASARIFGAQAVVYLSRQVPSSFAERLRAKGAKVVIAGDIYEESLQAAMACALDEAWPLISDSTWDGYDGGLDVMEGYSIIGMEIVKQIPHSRSLPSDIFLQAGVGGLAAAIAAYLRQSWGEKFAIHIVEPSAAPALQASISAGGFVTAESQDDTIHSCMGRLDCREPSLRALQNLAYNADSFITLSDAECVQALPLMEEVGLATSPSGGAGFAALASAELRDRLNINAQSRALCILSES